MLEIGYRDTNWAERCKLADPSLTVVGIDWRGRTTHPQSRAKDRENGPGLTLEQGDVLVWEPGQTFDVMVSLSAIEHIGLGHYKQDPIDADGDVKTIRRVRRWLKPGGWAYFDVPYTPEGYQLLGTKCRCYDDAALVERFGDVQVLGYTTPSVDGWIPKPVRNLQGSRPYYYVALLVRT